MCVILVHRNYVKKYEKTEKNTLEELRVFFHQDFTKNTLSLKILENQI